MRVRLEKASVGDAADIHRLQVESFLPLLQKYRDYETNPFFIVPEHQGKGYGQEAMMLVEDTVEAESWELNAILQEEGNCYLYEKMGYRRAEVVKVINDEMIIVLYEKGLKQP